MSDAAPALSVKDVHRHYKLGGHDIHVLKGVNFEIKQGERVFLCGPSGSGKTTLLYTLGGMESPTSGKIEILGSDLYEKKRFSPQEQSAKNRRRFLGFLAMVVSAAAIWLSIKSSPVWASLFILLVVIKILDNTITSPANRRAQVRNTQMGFVFQNYHLLPDLTALENVMLPSLIGGKQARDRAKELLARVGLGERLQHLPTELSGGEQQRTALARALINDPAIILADEPTGNLDAATGKQIMELLFTVVEEAKKTLVVVTHDQNLAKLGERTMVLKQGVLEAA